MIYYTPSCGTGGFLAEVVGNPPWGDAKTATGIEWTDAPPGWWRGAPGRLWSRCGRFAVTTYPGPYYRGFFYAAPGMVADGGMSFDLGSLAEAQAWCGEKARRFPEAALA